MTSEIKDILENMTTAAPEMEDYIGEDGLLYCGKCHTPKEAYFPEGKELFGRDRHPAECDCQRAAREQRLHEGRPPRNTAAMWKPWKI